MVFLLSVADRVTTGRATGAILHFAADGVRKLQIRTSSRGRGLFAHSVFHSGDVITPVAGRIVDANSLDRAASSEEVFQWSSNRVFVMQNPGGSRNLGILTNTAGNEGHNNARLVPNRRKQILNVCATRTIAPGDEILVPYGKMYVTKLKAAVAQQRVLHHKAALLLDSVAPVILANGAVKRLLCANCRKVLKASNRVAHARCCHGLLTSHNK
jgi:hypothetical protein